MPSCAPRSCASPSVPVRSSPRPVEGAASRRTLAPPRPRPTSLVRLLSFSARPLAQSGCDREPLEEHRRSHYRSPRRESRPPASTSPLRWGNFSRRPLRPRRLPRLRQIARRPLPAHWPAPIVPAGERNSSSTCTMRAARPASSRGSTQRTVGFTRHFAQDSRTPTKALHSSTPGSRRVARREPSNIVRALGTAPVMPVR